MYSLHKLLGAAHQAGQPGSIQPARIPVPLQCLHLTFPCKHTQRLSPSWQVLVSSMYAMAGAQSVPYQASLGASQMKRLADSDARAQSRLSTHVEVQARLLPEHSLSGLGSLRQYAASVTLNIALARDCMPALAYRVHLCWHGSPPCHCRWGTACTQWQCCRSAPPQPSWLLQQRAQLQL